MKHKTNLNIIILAAGKGKRMHSALPKVLHKLAGQTLLEHVVATAEKLSPKKIFVVYGSGGAEVLKQLKHLKVNWVLQKKQLGTGHAVTQVIPKIPSKEKVLILYGDVPLISKDTLQQFLKSTEKSALGVITAKLADPSGFGRIIRDNKNQVTAIVEHKDANNFEKSINEINTGILTTDALFLKKYLPLLSKKNAQDEYYLTDIFALARKGNAKIVGYLAKQTEEVLGVNDRTQLTNLERYYQYQIATKLQQQGVTIVDPKRFDVRGNFHIGKNVTFDVNVILENNVKIAANTTIGPNTILKNVTIGKDVEIKANCVIEGAEIKAGCKIGPFARIRPHSYLNENVHIGNFVEVKNSKIGKNSKANHLSYLGDCEIGKNVNIGAGTITCNYDGVNKHKTIIEDDVFVGSDVQFIAPVKIGKGATIGAGSTITTNTPPHKLTLSRAKQITIDNWVKPVKK